MHAVSRACFDLLVSRQGLHDAGSTHRDLKPSNIAVMDWDGSLSLLPSFLPSFSVNFLRPFPPHDGSLFDVLLFHIFRLDGKLALLDFGCE
jgi:serine/threonine protein kinase